MFQITISFRGRTSIYYVSELLLKVSGEGDERYNNNTFYYHIDNIKLITEEM